MRCGRSVDTAECRLYIEHKCDMLLKLLQTIRAPVWQQIARKGLAIVVKGLWCQALLLHRAFPPDIHKCFERLCRALNAQSSITSADELLPLRFGLIATIGPSSDAF